MKVSITLMVIFFSLLFVGASVAQLGQEGGEYKALFAGGLKLKIDGDLKDWSSVEGVFLGKDYWEALGEAYTDENDLSATWWVLWDENNLYVAIKAVDDVHQNTKTGDAIYAGDGIQFAIDPTGQKKVHSGNAYEYGYALASGKPSVWRWITNPASKGETSEYAIVRDEAAKTTIYEIRVPVGDIAPAELKVDGKIGWSLIVNESDACDCQGGWVGWGSRAIVYGKKVEPMGDLIFSSATPTAVESFRKLSTLWGKIKSM
jgi:hypothetical protein